MRRAAHAAALALGLAGLAGCQKLDDAVFGARVRAYLLAHPEVLQEAARRLDARHDADDAQARRRAQALLPSLRARIERNPEDFTANPSGRVTVTEFYDYRCPHCANAAPKVLEMIRAHPDVRFVFKEAPIFGALSEHAARAALAVRRAGGDSLGLYADLMSARDLDPPAIDRLARARGARPEDLTDKGLAKADAHLADTADLFTRLDLQGTPAFIVGDQIILGEDTDAVAAALEHGRGRLG
jgi:protein-disulfide isomerase